MAERRISLYPDTNLFIQCQEVSALPWGELAEVDEIELVVCRPVQKEIDELKGKGNSRVSDRARNASQLIRKILRSDSEELVIREADPRVRVLLTSMKPSEGLVDLLDYDEVDDQLVGVVAAARSQLGTDARVLSHDTGPMASAKRVDVPFVEIPDEWLLPPEPTGTDKKIQLLEAEVRRLKTLEPKVEVRAVDDQGSEIERIEGEAVRLLPLSREEFLRLRESLRSLFPPRVQREPDRHILSIPTLGETFVPPTRDEIDAYENDIYPQWLASCEDVFAQLHTRKAGWAILPKFRFELKNVGSRPANDSLITINAQGDFKIAVKQDRRSEKKPPPTLPKPPEALLGRWTNPLLERFGSLGSHTIAGILAGNAFKSPRFLPDAALRNFPIPTRDPNGFYWRDRPRKPTYSVSQECAQWRHGPDARRLGATIVPTVVEGVCRGILSCVVEAENLSTPSESRVPVVVTVSQKPPYEFAEGLIRELTKAGNRREQAG